MTRNTNSLRLPRFLACCDQLGNFANTTNGISRSANRCLLLGLGLFALSLPHSIAATYISLSLCVVSWMVRDLTARKFQFTRTPWDWPILCFTILTLLSSLASTEPSISLPKARSVLLFGVLYLCAANLHARAVPVLLSLLLVSGLAGVLFSLGEKLIGRGMIVTAIQSDSPLATSALQPGDVIWMMARRRVSSLDDAARVLRQLPSGKRIEIEAIHAGDPLPVEMQITDERKAQANPLGITVDGRSRRFRVSGFSRHFLTYAEQMQIFGLLLFGLLLRRSDGATGRAGDGEINTEGEKGRRGEGEINTEGEKGRGGDGERYNLSFLHSLSPFLPVSPSPRLPVSPSPFLPLSPSPLLPVFFLLVSLALILTASRAVIASFLLALVLVTLLAASRRVALLTLVAALALGSVAGYVLLTTRSTNAIRFNDDSTARRLGYMKAGLKLIPDHALLGVGMDAHKKHWQEWGFPGTYITHTHSTPIQIAMERGVPTLACYVWLMIVLGQSLWRSFKREGNRLALGTLAALLGFSLSSLTNYNFGDSEVVLLLLFLVALSLKKKRDE